MVIHKQNTYFRQGSFRWVKVILWGGIISFQLYACGPERREDLQDSGKVSVSDSTTQNTGNTGVGSGGDGYAQEGPQEVNTGTDSSGKDVSGNTPRENEPASECEKNQ